MTTKKTSAYEQKNEVPISKPRKRSDGELYARPSEDMFSVEWENGYEDGFENRPVRTQENIIMQKRYDDGYEFGAADREEVQRDGSGSNA